MNGVDVSVRGEDAAAALGRAVDEGIESLRRTAREQLERLLLVASFDGLPTISSAERALIIDVEFDYPQRRVSLELDGYRSTSIEFRQPLERGAYRATILFTKRKP